MEHPVSIEILHRVLACNFEDGTLRWRRRTSDLFQGRNAASNGKAWNARYAGQLAFTSKNEGYFQGLIFGVHYYAHRVIFALYHGRWPDDEVDHEDHDRSNNRIGNLSEATMPINMRNGTLRRNNTSGHVGVSWHKPSGKWRANIMYDGKQKSLGYFAELDDAVAARQAASEKHGYHANHGIPA